MTKESFNAELTKLCASGLAAGIITLEQFNQHIQIGVNAGSITSVNRSRTVKRARTSNRWNKEMFQILTDQVVGGAGYDLVQALILKTHGKRVTPEAIQTMVWKIRSGRVFDSAIYRREPIRTFLLDCQSRLRTIELHP